ncbi:Gfo/Idh/MocA family protein [Paenibacillus turpanensis]|uniref:Gfo/Idh/MocA family protein n=1 Tax=Paenibacillus turpanensis TaxID=2689078 RepID=UPI00140E5DE4|nr:Gfo/Idh/MocA family oxidoreductase [Paenibacillus turpanensis]
MTTPVKWGILGYARIAKGSVIPAILKADNSSLYAIATENTEKLEECKTAYPDTKLYSSYGDLLQDPEVQAVYIPLPNSMHKDWAIQAMRAGKHVLCEKPMALTAADCAEMIAVAAESRVLLMEAFMYRYTDRIRKVQDVLASGEIGELRFINSSFRFLLNRPNTIKIQPELGGGSLYDVGCYPISFVSLVTQDLPVSCSSEYIEENGVDMIFSAVLKYPNGVIASIHSGFNAYHHMRSEIIGTAGRIEVPDTFAGDAGAITVVTESGTRQVEVEESDRYTLEVADFADAILADRQPLVSHEETLRCMSVMDMLQQTLRS